MLQNISIEIASCELTNSSLMVRGVAQQLRVASKVYSNDYMSRCLTTPSYRDEECTGTDWRSHW
jgi:hypothetical protein